MGNAEDRMYDELGEAQYAEAEGQEHPPQKDAAVGERKHASSMLHQ